MFRSGSFVDEISTRRRAKVIKGRGRLCRVLENESGTKRQKKWPRFSGSSSRYINIVRKKSIALLVFFSGASYLPRRVLRPRWRYIKRKKFVTSWKGNRISVDNSAPERDSFLHQYDWIVDPDGWSASVTSVRSAVLDSLSAWPAKKCKFVNDTTPTDFHRRTVIRIGSGISQRK